MTRSNEVAGVITKDGQKEGFDLVVSNADVFHTYDALLRRERASKECAKSSRARITVCPCS